MTMIVLRMRMMLSRRLTITTLITLMTSVPLACPGPARQGPRFQFHPVQTPPHHHQPQIMDGSAVKFPGYMIAPVHSPPPMFQYPHQPSPQYPHQPPHPSPMHPQPQTPLSPEDLDAVIIEAKKKLSQRRPKQFSAVNFPDDNTKCLGYSMLGCV